MLPLAASQRLEVVPLTEDITHVGHGTFISQRLEVVPLAEDTTYVGHGTVDTQRLEVDLLDEETHTQDMVQSPLRGWR